MGHHKTYPLSFLFVLVTICAVGAGILANLISAFNGATIGTNQLQQTLVAGGFCGAILGFIMGCYRVDRGSGIFICGALGTMIGAVATCLYHVPADAFAKLLAAQIGGAVLILFLAAILRFGIRKDTE